MATKKAKTSSGTRAKSKTSAKKTGSNDKQQSFFKGELIVIVILLVSLFIFFANFGLLGSVGAFIQKGILGFFGVLGYVFPVALFAGGLFFFSNKGNPKIWLKILAGFFVFLSLDTIIYAVLGDNSNILDGNAGGILGRFCGQALIAVVDKLGCILLMLAVLIVSLVFITEKSFVSAVKTGSKRIYNGARENYAEAKENAQIKKHLAEEKRLARIDFAATDLTSQDNRGEQDSFESTQNELAQSVSDIRLKDSDEYSAETVETEEYDPNRFVGSIRMPESYDDEDDEEFYGRSYEDMDDAFRRAEVILGDIPGRSNSSSYTSDSYRDLPYTSAQGKSASASAGRTAGTGTATRRTRASKPYRVPPLNLLQKGTKQTSFSDKEYKETAIRLQQTLATFGINVKVTDISHGPTVTRYELHPEVGVKVSKVLSLQDDLKLALAAADIRIEAPIPGKPAIGIEVPNKENSMVVLRDILESPEYKQSKAGIAMALGKDIGGSTVVTDIEKMPHLLIAGATGSGKSVCINTLIMSILYKYTPNEVKLIMIDPKIVELSPYNGIPHLLIPVVTDVKKAAGTLNWAVAEMESRYRKFEAVGAKDMAGYNAKVEPPERMPKIVIIVDELADLMIQCKNDVEPAIARITQLARAAGMHMVIATQRPSVNVITGVIKGNIPSRIAFAATSGVDSRTILDAYGAERLLGKGDMLYSPQGAPKPTRIQGAYVSDDERDRVIDYIKKENSEVEYSEETMSKIAASTNGGGAGEEGGSSIRDELFIQAGRYIIGKNKASIGNLQRAFRIGFNRAARIMDQLCDAGVVGEEQGTKPREVLMSIEEFEEYIRQ